MNTALAATLLCLAALPCRAQEAPAAVSASASSAPASAPAAASAPDSAASATPLAGEPNVQHIVIEDKGSRIEELRVRGTTQRVTVTPKVGTGKSYEIIMGDGSRNLTDSANSSRGAAGQRVWTVLDF